MCIRVGDGEVREGNGGRGGSSLAFDDYHGHVMHGLRMHSAYVCNNNNIHDRSGLVVYRYVAQLAREIERENNILCRRRLYRGLVQHTDDNTSTMDDKRMVLDQYIEIFSMERGRVMRI